MNTEQRTIDRDAVPDSWACIDCGFNTAPGIMTRAELQAAFAVADTAEQTITHKSEVYTVHDGVWAAAGMEPYGGCLCIGCLERRLKRKLKPWDFPIDRGLNQGPGTPRLLKRRGKALR
jgi:hypothetical protein